MSPRFYAGDEPPSDAGVIAVQVRELSQLFDSMDPSPFHEKDLDRNAEEYIVSSARELPGKAPAELVVHLDVAELPSGAADMVCTAVRVHFARRALLVQRELRQLLRRGWISLAIGLLALAMSLLAGRLLALRIEDEVFGRLVQESLLIGGWVAMWRPMEILLYDWWGVLGTRRLYERLSRLSVRIVSASPTPGASADRST